MAKLKMVNQFVTYEIALKLRELGFNEECFGYYKTYLSDNTPELIIIKCNYNSGKYITIPEEFHVDAPLWQQAIDWVREKHNLHIKFMINDSYDVNDKTWEFKIFDIDWGGDRVVHTLYKGKGFKTFNEMREFAICKSIELIK